MRWIIVPLFASLLVLPRIAPLPITGYIQGPLRRQFDRMPDGKRFLMMFPPGR